MRNLGNRLVLQIVSAALAALALAADAHAQHRAAAARNVGAQAPHPIRLTMDELHAHGGVPRRWKFLLPPGDAAAGRQVFVALECHACHEVKGEDFPGATRIPRGAGPALTGMGAHHPPEYFAESIVNPNRVIVLGPGYTGADSFSRMPSYAEAMTLKQLIDVVAYLTSLTADE
jgi:hypothetical protein